MNGVWDYVVEGLGHPCLKVEYPLRDRNVVSGHHLGLEDYVNHMAEQVRTWETNKFVIVAHSLGGYLAWSWPAFTGRAAGFVAIGAAIPKRGGSFVSVLPFPLRAIMPIILKTAGTKPPESAIRNGLCSDLPEELASRIAPSLFRNPAESIRIASQRLFPMCQSFM